MITDDCADLIARIQADADDMGRLAADPTAPSWRREHAADLREQGLQLIARIASQS